MLQFFRRVGFGIFLLGLLLASDTSISARPEVSFQINYEPVKESISRLIWSELKNDVSGLTIALVDDQRLVWAQGFGYADATRDIVATPQTVYRIGTLTKVFTAAAIMQLVEQGVIILDRPLTAYVPEFSMQTRFPVKKPITIRNTLTHHAGLPSDLLKGMWNPQPQPFSSVVYSINNQYASYPSGVLYSYSNIGYDLLGSAIERTSRKKYVQYMHEAFFTPLGMTSSGFLPVPRSLALSKGYHRGKEIEEPLLRDLPAAGMYSNVLDLSRFLHLFFANGRIGDRQLLKKKTLTDMFKVQNRGVELDLGLQVGLGWLMGNLGEITIQNAGTVAHHAGTTLMFRSQIIMLPQHKLGVIVLANSSTAGRAVARIATQALSEALEVKTGIKQPSYVRSKRADVILPPYIRDQYAGYYASLLGMAAIIPRSDHFQVEAMKRNFRLVPLANSRFGVQYVLFGLFPFSFRALDLYEISYGSISGHEILKATIHNSDLLIAEKIQPTPIPQAWLDRMGAYTIVNLENDLPVLENIKLFYEDGFLIMECSLPFLMKGTMRYPLKPLTNTEAVLAGLGRGLGETISVVTINGKEMLSYSGYVLEKEK
ncbi:MAG: serine hydrolase domain-containing protein [Nitrospirota bacterium]